MPLSIVRNDITKMQIDAIVNAANSSLLGGGGVDAAIHRAAGPELLAECRGLGGCDVGDAKITGGYGLPCKYVIHTVGPIWQGGEHDERKLLASCYHRSLELAAEHNCETVAFPLISSGTYGYPKDQALQVAVNSITEFLTDHDISVSLVIYDKASSTIGEKLFADIKAYIDDHYVDSHPEYFRESQILGQGAVLPAPTAAPETSPDSKRRKGLFQHKKEKQKTESYAADFSDTAQFPSISQNLDKVLAQLDESFSEMLLRKIDERGLTDAQCYKKANIDRKLFSKIRSNSQYKPSKSTALAFAIALELPLAEANELLRKAGYALSHSSKFDVIVEYFIRQGNYNIFEINEALFAFDQSLLGG